MLLRNLIDIEANRKLHKRVVFQGLNISVENRKGSKREGKNQDGTKWSVKMEHDYGYILGSKNVGADKEHVDCFLGDNKDAENVYIVHQNKLDGKSYDEEKCLIGFDNLQEAKAAYLSNYDGLGKKLLGSITTMPMDEFKKKVLNPNRKAGMIL